MTPGRFARAVTAAVLVFAAGSAAGGDRTIATVDAAMSAGDRAVFVPLDTPVRILDTRRPAQGPALGSGATRSLAVTGANGVPADATAIVMNVTVVTPTASGYLTVFPAGPARPTVSSLNFSPKQTIPNLVTVKPGAGGQVSFFNSSGTSHVLADLAGYYVGHDHDDRYLPAATAQARLAPNSLTCPVGELLRAVAQDGTPTCATDASGPSYASGFGILIDGDTISAEQGRSAKNAFSCELGYFLRAIAADGEPTCDPTAPPYEAGFGITIDGTTISAQQGRSAAGAFNCPAGQYLRAVAADGAPSCSADLSGPTYTAGHGITLSNNQFAAAAGTTLVPVRGDGTPEANGAALRSAIASIGSAAKVDKPYVVLAAPGTYALGSSILSFPPYVSLVGSGRGQTIITGTAATGNNGLLAPGEGALLSSLSVTNATAGSTQITAAVVVTGASARIFDVAARATETAGNSFGIVAYSGARVVVEQSVVSAHNTVGGLAYGIYSVSNSTATVRDTEIKVTTGSGGIISGLETSTGGVAEFTNGSIDAPIALKLGPGTTMRVANSKVVGTRSGAPVCFGNYDASYAAVTC